MPALPIGGTSLDSEGEINSVTALSLSSQDDGGKAPCCVYKIFQNADLGEFHVLLAQAAKIVAGEIRIYAWSCTTCEPPPAPFY